MMSIVAFLIVIGVCVLIHEGGHYFAAVWRRVQVHEFSFGMGPAVVSHRRKGVLWAFRAFPIGGFVRLEGDESERLQDEIPDPERSFNIRRPWERFVIIAGGAAANIALAWLITVVLLMFHGTLDTESPIVGSVMPGYPAEAMGVAPGDRVVSVNGVEIERWPQIRETLQTLESDEIEIKVLRGENELTFTGIVPISDEHGVRLWGIQPARVRYGPFSAAARSFSYCFEMSSEILSGLWQIITRQIEADVAGPVGIAVMAGNAARSGFWTFITFLSVINLNLGLINLLPLPALDGGRLVFILGEMLSGKRFPDKWENRVHIVGLALLLVLIALITWKDIVRLLG